MSFVDLGATARAAMGRFHYRLRLVAACLHDRYLGMFVSILAMVTQRSSQAILVTITERLRSRRFRAFFGIGELAAFTFAAVAVSAGVSALAYTLKISSSLVSLMLANNARTAITSQFLPDARSAMFVGILPTDVSGNAQGGTGTSTELDFYTRDSAHHPYLWAYAYDNAAQTLKRVCFDDPTTHTNLRDCGQTLSGVTTFAITVETASSAASGNAALTGTAIQNIAPQGLSVSGITASNRVAVVHLVTADSDETYALTSGISPTGYTVIVGRYFKPGPLLVGGSATGFAVMEPVGVNFCIYASDASTHTPCTVAVSEEYYGGGGENTPGNFSVNQGNCGSNVTISPSIAAGNSTTPVPFTITSTTPTVCTFFIVDDHGDSNPVQVTIWGPLVVNPAKLDFRVGGDTSPNAYNTGGTYLGHDTNGAVTVSEQNFGGPFTLADGDLSNNGGCGSNVAGTWNGSGWNLTTPAAATPGDCTMHVTDGHGGAQQIAIHIGAPLLVNTGSGFAPSGSLSWNRPSDGTQTYAVHESVYSGAFSVSDNCGGNITDTVASGGGNGTDSTYNVTPSQQLSCTITIIDTRGNVATVTLNVLRPDLLQQFVCDPQSPARPLNTDLGPDPDGIHEDYSNGSSCAPTPVPTVIPSPASGVCAPNVCLTIMASVQQTLPNPPYTTSQASNNSCAPGTKFGLPANQCPYNLGSIPININRIDQTKLCWIAFNLLSSDNDGWPISLLSMTADVTPVAWYDSLTGFLYVVNDGSPSQIWTPPGFLVSATPFPFEDMYYIQNLFPPGFNPGARYVWVALSYWLLPPGSDASGPVPLTMDGGLVDPFISNPGRGIGPECSRDSTYGGPYQFGT